MKYFLCFMIDHPAFISAFSAFLALAFSIYVYIRTQKLFKQTSRPMLSPGEIKYSNSQIHIFLKNSGEHPAKDLRVLYGVGPLCSPEQYKLVGDRNFVNNIGIGGGSTITLERGGLIAKVLYFRFRYKDALTSKPFHEEIWLQYNSESRDLSEPTRDVIERFLPYIK